MALKDEFKEWACSLQGCDGGNPSADIWLCGIEWGGAGDTEESWKKYYNVELPAQFKEKKPALKAKYPWEESFKERSSYGRSAGKIIASYYGQSVENYYDFLCAKQLELFKLNLYPIAFGDASQEFWDKYGLSEKLGFDDKYSYQLWCMYNRFPALRAKAQEHNPTVIIGTGISYCTDFFKCFAPDNFSGIPKKGIIHVNGDERTYRYAHIDLNSCRKTLLIVIPFFSGRYGLNSNALLEEMGKRIKAHSEEF